MSIWVDQWMVPLILTSWLGHRRFSQSQSLLILHPLETTSEYIWWKTCGQSDEVWRCVKFIPIGSAGFWCWLKTRWNDTAFKNGLEDRHLYKLFEHGDISKSLRSWFDAKCRKALLCILGECAQCPKVECLFDICGVDILYNMVAFCMLLPRTPI